MAGSLFGPRSKAQRRQRSTGKRSTTTAAASSVDDTNISEIVASQAQNERALRKQALRDSLQAEKGQISSKKRKRLDKYVEKKLKKDENLELIKKLAGSKTDTSFLRSSRSFGGVERRHTATSTFGPPITQNAVDSVSTEDNTHSEGEGDDKLQSSSHLFKASNDTPVVVPPKAPPIPIGSGLKRPLQQDASGAPVIRKRQRIKSTAPATNDDPEWEGFSSNESQDSLDQAAVDQEGSSELLSDSSDDGDDDDEDEDSEGLLTASEDEEEVNSIAASMLAAIAKKKSERDSQLQKPIRDLSAWRSWATEQMNEARDFAPSRPLEELQAALNPDPESVNFKPRAPEQDELPAELRVPATTSGRETYAVNVERSEDVQGARLKLPVVAEEQKIMECIHNNPITIVCGATGSGKTTQIPQFLFEAGYGDSEGPTPGMIGITQPRRVAAVTMARRVSHELGNFGSKVAYQIRYGTTVGKDTALKFMTDGILIREIATDFSLSKYSAIVIDEAHERSVNTDILIGMLSRIVDLRQTLHQKDAKIKPLKLIIMSATLMIKAFTENPNLFKRGSPPLVESEGRQYPVTMHFARRTQRDYLEEVFKKVKRGHKKLPPGAILVFLTGESEIIALSQKLKEAFGIRSAINQAKVRMAATEAPLEAEDYDEKATQEEHDDRELDDYDANNDDDDDEEDDEEKEFDVEQTEDDHGKTVDGALILPLYSKLPTRDQLRVFEPPPENTRLIVLSTNVAETSVTIPGVRYVFDCGRSKEKRYDQNTGVQSFDIDWISKASAAQRAGRAGRTGPGHCYRLYSSAVYERDFADHAQPEILRMPVEGVVLQLKSMDLRHVVNFPFPTPPEQSSIIKAERLLAYLSAIDSAGKVTSIGRHLSLYPLSPRFAKMLAVGHQQGCMILTIAMVAALATPELFIPDNQVSEHVDGDDTGKQQNWRPHSQAHISGVTTQSDAFKMLAAFAEYKFEENAGQGEELCKRVKLRSKAMKEASQLFHQLLHIVADNSPGLVDPSTKTIPMATEKQIKYLKQIVAVGYIDQVAIRADLAPIPPDVALGKRGIEVPYLTLFPSHEGRAEAPEERLVYIHASSVLANLKASDMPQYVVYSNLQRGNVASIAGKVPKVRMRPLTPVTAAQLTALARGTPLLEFGKPVGKIETLPGTLDKRVCWVVPSLVGQRGRTSWPLPARKVIQKRGPKGSWEVEKMAT